MKIHILGSGVMASAMAYGLKSSGFEVTLVARNKDKISNLSSEFEIEEYGKTYDISSKNIILAFKPYALKQVSSLLKGKADACISVLARTSLEDVKSSLNSEVYAICLPNIAAKFAKSITPFISNSPNSKVEEILDGFGSSLRLETKNELDAASVIAGCAPAFLAVVAEALSNAAVFEGLKKDAAKKVVEGLFDGFSALLASSHPALIKEAVCSPGGTTIEGVAKLEEFGLRNAFFKAVNASANKQRS